MFPKASLIGAVLITVFFCGVSKSDAQTQNNWQQAMNRKMWVDVQPVDVCKETYNPPKDVCPAQKPSRSYGSCRGPYTSDLQEFRCKSVPPRRSHYR